MSQEERLVQLQRRGLSRRQFLERSAALGISSASALAFLAACGPSGTTSGPAASGATGGKPAGADGPVKLSFFVYVGANQGVVPREVVAEYTKENPNVTIELYEGTNAETYPKMVAARKTTPDQPIVNFGYFNADATAKGDVDDMWEPLDTAAVPTLGNVLDNFKRKDNKGIAWGMVGIGLMYNTEHVKTAPTSWMDFWDSRFKGRLALSQGNHYLSGLVTTTRAQGGKESDPAAVDKAFKLISDKAKEGQIKLFFLSNDQVKQPMIRGEVWLSGWFNSSVDIWANQEKGPFGYAAPKEGQIAFTLYHQIVKGSTAVQKYHAQRIINMLNDKKWLSRYCNLTHSIPVAKDIQLDAELANQEAFKSRNIEGAMQLDWPTLAAKNSEWKERWDKEVVAYVK
ncbi:MAG TPA: extracellular solute-binding protein [Candidatus Limnocylindria bacterium]|nr:extracellular solute-binding protein [Candidatus Limnocylindria bacterium]